LDHTRHMGLYTVPSGFSVTIIGAGGIGAITALTLAKMGVQNMVVYDDDVVSEENIATQLHKWHDVGVHKVFGLMGTLREFSDDVKVEPILARVIPESALRSHLIISAVDSIAARKHIWVALQNSHWDWYLDMRMALEEIQTFLLDDSDAAMKAYGAHLSRLTDDNVIEAPCTMKSTFYTAMLAAGYAGKVLRDIVRKEAVPHRLVHNIPTNWLETFPL
jgi:hypothetical protein